MTIQQYVLHETRLATKRHTSRKSFRNEARAGGSDGLRADGGAKDLDACHWRSQLLLHSPCRNYVSRLDVVGAQTTAHLCLRGCFAPPKGPTTRITSGQDDWLFLADAVRLGRRRQDVPSAQSKTKMPDLIKSFSVQSRKTCKNSVPATPACFKMPCRVPTLSSRWSGTAQPRPSRLKTT
jgi:hypothetical protein